MKITTAWCDDGYSNTPWLVNAYDEFTFDECNGEPDGYTDAVIRADGVVREVIIDLGDFDPRSLFAAPEITGVPATQESTAP